MPQKILELKPIKESPKDFEKLEERIKYAFRKLFYEPLMQEYKISNSIDDLVKSLNRGTIQYSNGAFKGYFDASISKELRAMGAKWNKGEYKIPLGYLPMDIRSAISTGNVRQNERIARIDKKLSEVDPAKIADSVKSADIMKRVIEKTNREVKKTLKSITVLPELSAQEMKKIADEWQNNMDLWIVDFTKEEIVRLRKDIAKSTAAGDRQSSIIKSIQRSYGITENKAKFLARQETSLLMAKFKETRYTKAGINEYRWGCVAGSALHPVRPLHKILENKIHSWDNPPITSEDGRRNNPGQDYNCRCFARPVARFKEKS